MLGPVVPGFWAVVAAGVGPSLSSRSLKAVLIVLGEQGLSCPQFGRVDIQDRGGTGRRCVWDGKVGGGAGFWLVTHSATEVVTVTWS